MEIPLQAQVECTDGFCGRTVFVLKNPINEQVTHLLVKEDQFPNPEYVVPVDYIAETMVDTIRLRCSKAELEKMVPFIKKTFIEEKVSDRNLEYVGGGDGMGSTSILPHVNSEITVQMPVEHQQILPGELAEHRGTPEEAADGFARQLDELAVSQENGDITHLVMQEGHLWV